MQKAAGPSGSGRWRHRNREHWRSGERMSTSRCRMWQSATFFSRAASRIWNFSCGTRSIFLRSARNAKTPPSAFSMCPRSPMTDRSGISITDRSGSGGRQTGRIWIIFRPRHTILPKRFGGSWAFPWASSASTGAAPGPLPGCARITQERSARSRSRISRRGLRAKALRSLRRRRERAS